MIDLTTIDYVACILDSYIYEVMVRTKKEKKVLPLVMQKVLGELI